MVDTARDQTLDFLTPGGDEVRWTVRPDRQAAPRPSQRSGIVERVWLVRGNDQPLIQRRLDPRANPHRLDTEIAAGLRLARRYPDNGYPAVLPRMLGYRADIDEPYVLWQPPPATEVGQVAARLGNDAIDRVLCDLLTALAHLAAAGIVHRGVNDARVRWTGEGAMIAGLPVAAFAGDTRTGFGREPWASAEQARGIGRADPRDDVWSAAVLLGVLLGLDGDSYRERLGPRYAVLLGDALAPRAAQRPTAAELLRTLSWPVPAVETSPLDSGREQYERIRASRAEAAAPAARPPQRRRRWFWSIGRGSAGPATRDCYLCLDPVSWAETDLFVWTDKGYKALDLGTAGPQHRREYRLRQAFRRCPNRTGEIGPHYLPAAYLRSGSPINIGLIGDTAAGKTHLLAGIMQEIESGVLGDFGIMTSAVDIAWHDDFRQSRMNRLYRDGEVLEHTRPVDTVDFADGLILGTGSRERPMMFFDIAGEMLQPGRRQSRATQFLAAADALIFVADPVRSDPDTTFEAVIDRLAHRRGPDGLLDIPSVVVVTKSDLLRFEEPVDRWIRARRADGPAESRDVYAYLHQRGRTAQLAPMHRIRRCTLHFASATGGRDRGGRYPHGARPQRCAEPLISLLAMLGALPARRDGDG
ncbi:hypothetical protein FHR83_008782 [Actinoplanes campanulatus]|uniref:Double-GTPase 2 domain-containing protein n=1 Tax=Actinoplanes campanulatus TaxID=113559 RepID=A0A7W5AS92_9ACTN|nr:GTPase domain-containing protein [Actinoplanes campanulatus]MBB3101054.1 hypothetical protein [Actinoplanes campanulatus]GGN49408.1 hypothetical protein GCM10010109_87470 [Actinoplanes campanulatus]GID41854.1 hypothetical protein Aca09nite_83600 [Actinoplanes campanulatus]